MADINMRILLSAAGGAGVSSAISSIGNSMGGLNKALLGIGVAAAGAAIGLGVASVNAASQFQTAMDLNVAHAGLAKDQVDNVTKALLNMGPAVGQSPTILAQSMYPVLSSLSGISNQSAKTALALDEVKLASESVAGSTTSVTDVTNAASAAFNAYGLQTNNASTNTARMNNLFDVMNKTVSDGNMQWNVYSTAIGKLSVASHATGVSFNETNAALADLTNSGYSAQLGATYLGNTYNTLYIKTDAMAKNAKSLGISFDETKYKTMDLGQRLTYLKDITGGNQSELLKLMGGNSVALKTFDALSNSIGQYKSNLNDLNHAQGGTAQAFQTSSSSFGFAMQKVQAAGQNLLITIGLQLLPTLTKIATSMIPVIMNMSNWIAKSGVLTSVVGMVAGGLSHLVSIGSSVVSFFQHNTAAMEALKVTGLVVAGVVIASLVFGFYTWAAAAAAAAAMTLAAMWPFLAIGAAIGLVVGGFILAYNKIKPFHDLVNGIAQSISSNFLPVLHMIGDFLVATFAPVWNQLVQVWQTQIMPSVNQLIAALSPLLTVLKMIGLVIGGVFVVALGLIIGSISGIIGAIAGFLQGLAIAFGGLVQIFTGIVQIISGIVTFIVDLFTGHFDKLQGDLKGILGGITNIFSGFGTMVRGIFTGLIKGVTGGVSGFATGVVGFFNQIVHGVDNHTQHARDVASLHTLQMKDQSLQHTQQMAQQSVGHLQQEAQGIEQQIKTAKDSVTRNHLEMKLKAVEQTIAMKQAVVGHCQEMRTQVAVQMTQMREAVNGKTISMRDAAKIHTLEMKDAVLKNDQETEKGQLKILDQQAQDVQREYSKAKDSATRQKLQEKFQVIQHQIETKKGVLQHTTDMRTQVESQLDTLRKGASDRFGSIQKDIKNIVGNVTSWLKNTWNNTVKWIVDKFKFLYDHNYYFHDLVNNIRQAFKDAENWIHTTWNNVTSWLSTQWSNLVKSAQQLWADIAKPFQDAWNQYISPALTSLWNSITGWWSGTVVPAASTLGSNIIHAIADGVSSAAGAVNDAIQGAINSALQGLGFHDLPGMPKHAAGIIDNPVGHLATIGEEGPELMVIGGNGPGTMYVPRGASIYPHSVYAQLTASGGTSLGGTQLPFTGTPVATRAVEKKQHTISIQQIRPELHIHTSNTKLDHAQIQDIIDRAVPQFGQQIADYIRAQFGSI